MSKQTITSMTRLDALHQAAGIFESIREGLVSTTAAREEARDLLLLSIALSLHDLVLNTPD